MKNTKAKQAQGDQPPIRTMSELAMLVGRDKSQVSRWTKRSEWPFSRVGPWPRSDVPAILKWVAGTIAGGDADPIKPADADEIKTLKRDKLENEVRKLLAQAETAETALARERGKLLDAAEVENEWASIGNLIRTGFQNLSSQIVPMAISQGMPHEAVPIFQEQLEAAIKGILRHLSNAPEDDEDGSQEAPAGAVPA